MNEIRQAEVDGQPMMETPVHGRPPWSQGPLSPLPAKWSCCARRPGGTA